jgi:hypothetical protein
MAARRRYAPKRRRASRAGGMMATGLRYPRYAGMASMVGATYKAALEAARNGDTTMLKNRIGTRWRGDGLYTGSGAFWDDAKAWGSRLYGGARDLYNRHKGAGGTFIKAGLNAVGAPLAADALTALETAGIAAGYGDYTAPAVSNDIVNGGGASVVPSFKPLGDGNGVCITHREFISDIFGPETAGGFQNTVYSINPALVRTFPWLAQVAANYEEYTMRQLIFTYRSTVTDFVANNGQVGSIIMATQYNPSDSPFASKQDAMEYDLAESGKVSMNMLHGVECDPKQLSGAAGKFTRAGPVTGSQDLKQYDWGNLNVAISNIPAQFENQALGELWVSYTVELRKPKFFVSRGLSIQRDTFVAYASPDAFGDVAKDSLVGNQNRIGGQFYQVTANDMRYKFPATFSGTVRITLVCTSTFSGAIVVPSIETGAIVPYTDIWGKPVGQEWASTVVTQAGSASAQTVVSILDVVVASPKTAGVPADNVIYFSGTGTFTKTHLDITQINTGFGYTNSGVIMLDDPQTGVLQQLP